MAMRFTIFLIIYLTSGILPIHAAERVVLLEQFTNVDGRVCAYSNPRIDRVINEYTGRVIAVKYHVWWPSADDPLYLTFGENLANQRTSYYDVRQLPELYVDGLGVQNDSPLQRGFRDISVAIQERLNEPSPLEMVAQLDTMALDLLGADTLRLGITITNEETITLDSLALYLIVVEDNIEFPNPPGRYREKRFRYVVRRMLPDGNGRKFTMAAGETRTFADTLVKSPNWKSENIYGVYFIQNAEGEVIQTATSRHRFGLRAEKAHLAVGLGQVGEFRCQLENFTAQASTYNISLNSTMPDFWTSTWSLNSFSQIDSFAAIEIGHNSIADISISVKPLDQGGEARFRLEAFPIEDSSQVVFKEMVAFSDVSILLVDDDGFFNHEKYYLSVLDTMPIAVGRWQPDLEAIPFGQMGNADALFWWTGWSHPSLDSLDREFLHRYLDRGGNLFLSGQDIGWDLCASASSTRTENSVSFYENILQSNYLADHSESFQISGQSGDPVAASLSFNITNGVGADNQFYPSLIDTIPPAEISFTYQGGGVAGIRAIHDSSIENKILYLAFGFEAIDSRNTQKKLLENVISWFGLLPTAPIESDDLACEAIKEFRLHQNFPNPFNPKTRIIFDVLRDCHVRLFVYNTLGQMITTLTDDWYPEGRHQVEFYGQDLPSGVYFYAIHMNNFFAVRRGVLLR